MYPLSSAKINHSLMDHLGSGREWDLARKKGGLNNCSALF